MYIFLYQKYHEIYHDGRIHHLHHHDDRSHHEEHGHHVLHDDHMDHHGNRILFPELFWEPKIITKNILKIIIF